MQALNQRAILLVVVFCQATITYICNNFPEKKNCVGGGNLMHSDIAS
jgi:hypothetical protein